MGLHLVLVGPFRVGSEAQLDQLRRRVRVLDDAVSTLEAELASLDDEGPAPVAEKLHVVGRPRRKGWTSTYDRARNLIRMESQLTGAIEELPLPQLLRKPAGNYFIDADGDLSRAIPKEERAASRPRRFTSLFRKNPKAERRSALIDEEEELIGERERLLAGIEELRVDPLSLLQVRRVGDDAVIDEQWVQEQMASFNVDERTRFAPQVRERMQKSRGAPVYSSTPFPDALPAPCDISDRLSLFVGPTAIDIAAAGELAVAERLYDPFDPDELRSCAAAFNRVAAKAANPERVIAAARWMSFWAGVGFSARPRS